MQKVIYRDQIESYSDCIDQSIIDYIAQESIETYESLENFSLIAFDWYNMEDLGASPAQIIVYLDREDLFYICENEVSFRVAESLFEPAGSNESALYASFRSLLRGKEQQLERIEDRISALDDAILQGSETWKRDEIMKIKYETLRLKKFFEPLESVLELLCGNDNGLIGDEYMKHFVVLHTRAADLAAEVRNLREYIAQVRESYQAQIGIEQNHLMKVFTLVTSIFLPLTLLVGWYGMNFSIPEFSWRFGYPGVIILSLAICAAWFIIFRRNKWFK